MANARFVIKLIINVRSELLLMLHPVHILMLCWETPNEGNIFRCHERPFAKHLTFHDELLVKPHEM